MELKTVTSYVCPGGMLETDKERAVAWHIVEAGKASATDSTKEPISFSAALAIVKHRKAIRVLLSKIDGVEDDFEAGRGVGHHDAEAAVSQLRTLLLSQTEALDVQREADAYGHAIDAIRHLRGVAPVRRIK